MIEQITATTDGKYIGVLIETHEPPILRPDGVPFYFDKMQALGGNMWRYSNSSYVVETIEINEE